MVKDVVGRICDQRDFESHMNYLHINPVKHGLVTKVSDGLIQLFINWLSVAFIRKIGLGNLRYRVVSCYIKFRDAYVLKINRRYYKFISK